MADQSKDIEAIRLKLKEFMQWTEERTKEEATQDWSSLITPHLSIVSVSSDGPCPRITFRMKIQPIHCNAMQNLHGGCTSTLFDYCTSLLLLLVSRPGYWQHLGVSRTLNVTYLRPAPLGTDIDIDCELVHVGKRLCATRGVLRVAADEGKEGLVLAICEHGKVNTDPPAEKL